MDDIDHDVRAFFHFISRVKPTYAIPFASNSCLLHRDVAHMNSLSQTPLHVKSYFDRFALQADIRTQLQIMVPGDEWNDNHGFTLQEHDYFTNREKHLIQYAAQVSDKLQSFYAREDRVKISLDTMTKFIS